MDGRIPKPHTYIHTYILVAEEAVGDRGRNERIHIEARDIRRLGVVRSAVEHRVGQSRERRVVHGEIIIDQVASYGHNIGVLRVASGNRGMRGCES